MNLWNKKKPLARLFYSYVLCVFLSIRAVIADDRPLIITTTTIVNDVVSTIVGDAAEVRALMGPGVDPHLYKASHGDLISLRKADVIFYNGLHLEGKMEEIFQNLKKSKRVYALSEGVDVQRLTAPPEFSGQFDPHIWFDVSLWIDTVSVVERRLVELLPAQASAIKKRSADYVSSLKDLHQYVLQRVSEVESSRRVLITAHDAFGYFGRAYGFQVAGLQGISTASEFGLHDVQRIVDLIVFKKLKAIFIESSVPVKFIESVRQGVLAKGGSVSIGGTLYSDALGEPGSKASTYISMVKYNCDTIVEALK